MLRRLIGLVLLGWLALAAPVFAQPAPADDGFANWAAVIVAGDWRAHGGGPSEVFDNARRDLAKALAADGFAPDHIRQFSVREAGTGAGAPLKSDPDVIYDQLGQLTARASAGCLVYFTSHGSPDGILVDESIWPPGVMAALVDQTCGQRPTVVVISACFSGVFAPALAGRNRMVLTAARADRASFGCGQEDRYTFFDACVLGELASAHDFAALGVAVQRCVARRERALGASPPSEPQLEVGLALRPVLPLYAFSRTRGDTRSAALSPRPPAP
ncbi:MAG: C13 family peptidase [Caulobacteraceae bacterium]|nr:C13 family peptidase [Caulobacteraceae bacterium]